MDHTEYMRAYSKRDYVRIRQNKWRREYRLQLKKKGICGVCTVRPLAQGSNRCDECRNKRRIFETNHRVESNRRKRAWEAKNREKVLIQKRNASRRSNRRLKQDIVRAYGGKCVCCGESNFWFLTIDHIDRESFPESPRTGKPLYAWLKKHNYPRDGIRLLCYNCNCAKGFLGECPHVAEPPGRWTKPATGLMKKRYPKEYERFYQKAKRHSGKTII